MPLRLQVTNDTGDLPPDECVREFAGAGATIGRNPDNDWVLPDERRYLSGRHAIIDYQGGAWYLVDTSRNGVFVNGADTPVGRGHPQRLFDGDRLRIGTYEIAVEIRDDGKQTAADGMRDSVVRAQLVPEAESVELQLVTSDRLFNDATLKRHLTPGESLLKRVRSVPRAAPGRGAPAPAHTAVAAIAAAAQPSAGAEKHSQALQHLLEGAGLDVSAVAGSTEAEIMQAAGRLLRELVGGLMALLRERNSALDAFCIPQQGTEQTESNPLKFSPGTVEALRYLLNDRRQDHYLSSDDAVRAAFREFHQHEQAFAAAVPRAARDYCERFDPTELRQHFDKGLKRGGLLAGTNKLKYWDLYEEGYALLSAGDADGAPRLFVEDFSRAYGEALETVRRSRRRP